MTYTTRVLCVGLATAWRLQQRLPGNDRRFALDRNDGNDIELFDVERVVAGIKIIDLMRFKNSDNARAALGIAVLMNAVMVKNTGRRFIHDRVTGLKNFLRPQAVFDIGDFVVERNFLPDLPADHAVGIVKEAVFDLHSSVETEGDQKIALVEV